jgi:hypothetical protein
METKTKFQGILCKQRIFKQTSAPGSFSPAGQRGKEIHFYLRIIMFYSKYTNSTLTKQVSFQKTSESVNKNQLDAQLIPSTFRQIVHVSSVSRPIIRRYNRAHTTIGTYYSF